MNNYVIYHLHSDLSNGVTNIDSVTKYYEYIDKAAELGMTAMGFSEHGSVLEWIHKKQKIEAAGMKYIHAEEFYITDRFYDYPEETPKEIIEAQYGKSKTEREEILAEYREKNKKRVNNRYHVVLIAKNYDGVRELNTLSSLAFHNDGHFYYSPRITMDELEATSNNILVTTACIAGVLCKGDASVKERFLKFLIKNKDRCYLEIQHHNVDIQKQYNLYLARISKEYGIPLIAGTDTHALNETHVLGRTILQKSKDIHFDDEEGWDLTFKTFDELVQAYEVQGLSADVYMPAIEETTKMADRIEEFPLDFSYKYPKLYEDSEAVLLEKIEAGIKERGVDKFPNYQEYRDRINHEVEVFKHNGAIDFILLEDDYKNALRERGIRYGYSRGSVSGSIVCWLLHITEVDSIKYNLNFDRFMNEERISLADVDSDFYEEDRPKVREYLFNKEGLHCCNIITFNTIKMRGAIKDVGRALGMTPQETQDISNLVETVDGKDFIDDKYRKKWPELFKYVDIVSGVIVSLGRHAAGLVVSPHDVDPAFGTLYISSDDRPISQINMKEIDYLNYVKLDILGLDCVGLIYKTCDMVGIPFLTPDNMDFNDQAVWDDLKNDTTLCFQFESDFAGQYLRSILRDDVIRKIKEQNDHFSYIDVMSMANGAIRPAGASYREQLSNGIYNDCGDDALNKYFAPTLGFLVYQEEIIGFLNKFCGFTMGEADVVRRCVEENTEITLADGRRKLIKDVAPGDLVQSYNDDNISCYKKVLNVFNNGEQEVFEITCSHGYSLRATKEHKVLTQRGWIRLGDLSDTDYLFTPNQLNAYVDNSIKPNQRLDKSDMFLIGMLIGDGSIGDIHSIHFTNSDIELIEKFKECVQKREKHVRPNDKCDFRITAQEGVTVDKVCAVSIATKKYKQLVTKLLQKYDLVHKAADKYIPDELMAYPANEKLLGLLGGLFSTDSGYCSNASCIEYYTISYRLANDVKQLLLKFGIYSYVYFSDTNGYDYLNYKVRINQRDSLIKFNEVIIPNIVGKKRDELAVMVNNTVNNPKSYNYLLPGECKAEIERYNKINPNVSMNAYKIDMNGNGLKDTTAKRISNDYYIPYTYRLLHAQYIPVPIRSIKSIGVRHVYDLEIEDTHNYVADGLIVHNCFSKKIGTEQYLPLIKNGGDMKSGHYIKGFIKTMVEEYGRSEEEAEAVIGDFLQVIQDASDYLFSKNHSDPYSMLGYACAYLRHYYPLEFLTVALNVYTNDDKIANIKQYINRKKFVIAPIKFGFSGAKYTCDKATNTIYQGISAIKGLNGSLADELLDISKREHKNFISLLVDISQNSKINSAQLSTLIKLDFFSEYGEINKLQLIYEAFDGPLKQGATKSINKEKVPVIFQAVGIENYANGITKAGKEAKTWTITNIDGLMDAINDRIINNSEIKPASIRQQIEWQQEYLGYVSMATGKVDDIRRIYITHITPLMPKFGDSKVPWSYRIEAFSIGTGKSSVLYMKRGVFKYHGGVSEGDVLFIPGKGLVKSKAKDGKEFWNITQLLKETR